MTKSSSIRKRRQGKKHSNLSAMRKKLTLKYKNTPVHLKAQEEEEVMQEADSNTKMEEETFNAENNVIQEEDANIEEEGVILTQVKSKKFFQRASPMKLVKLYPSLLEDQKTLIRNNDYGGLLDIKCSKLVPELCQYLMYSFDPTICRMIFPGRGSIPVTEVSVSKVMGVPLGRLEVQYVTDNDAIAFMKEQLGHAGRKQPTIAFLEEKLVGMESADSKFLRLFITLGMCSVLAPTTGIRISPSLYPSLVNIKKAKHLNMCKFVIMILCKALGSPEGKGKVRPCMLYLMVKYLDSLQLEGMHISAEGTRVSVWTNAMVRKAIKQDTRSDGTFGGAPLKPEFRDFDTQSETRNKGNDQD